MSERIEVYRTFVGTITAAESRRQRASTAYLGMVAAVATVSVAVPGLSKVWLATVILVVALTWLATVAYFRRLAKAKFAVIEEIENGMEIPVFRNEWRHFKRQNGRFAPSLTRLEMVPPFVIALSSGVYVAYRVFCSAFFLCY